MFTGVCVCAFQSRIIKEEANELIVRHEQLMIDIAQQKQEAQGMLDNGIRQQQVKLKQITGRSASSDCHIYDIPTLLGVLQTKTQALRINSP